MHEIYIAEKIIKKIEKTALENKADKVLEVNVVIPEDEHFTEDEFKNILKMQAEGTILEKAKFIVISEKTDTVYVKDIKVL